MTPDEPAGLRELRLLRRLTILLYVVMIAAVILVYRDSASKRQALRRDETNTNAALCALRADLQHRVKASEDFLTEHPAGAFGIPAATIQANLTNQEHTLTALAGLRCE